MDNAQFISVDKIKEDTLINSNVDNKLIVPLILDCQIDQILPVIGSGLYSELVSQITNNTLTTLNRTLLDQYIIPCLEKYVVYEACISINFKLTNANFAKKNTEDSQPLTIEEMLFFMDKIKDKAEVRKERITKYLVANITSYPLYANAGSSVDTVHPSRENYTSGLYLGLGCKYCGKYETGCMCMTNMKTSSPN